MADKRKNAKEAFVLWFTGLPCSGKSTLSEKVLSALIEKGYRTEGLDGDRVRAVFPRTGFSKEERDAHIRRMGFIASLLERNGIITVCSFVSPYAEARAFARKLCGNFIEVYVSTPVKECEKRDVKGMYAKARAGEVKNFTGVDDPYEPPADPEITVDTMRESEQEALARIMDRVKGYLE